MKHVCALVLLLCMWSEATHALDREQQRGKALLQTLCGRCHAVGQAGRSPHPEARPCSRRFAAGVTPSARQAEVPIPRRRHFEVLARTSFTITTLDNDCMMA